MCKLCYMNNKGVLDISIEYLECCCWVIKIPSKLTNLRYLNCHNSININHIPDTLVNLTLLYVSKTKVRYISPKFTNLTTLCIENTYINEIPDTLLNLTDLYCGYSSLREIPKNLTKISDLRCNNTQIRDISHLTKLKSLICVESDIKYIDFAKFPHLTNLYRCTCIKTSKSSIRTKIPLPCEFIIMFGSKRIAYIKIQRLYRKYIFRRNYAIYKTLQLPYDLFNIIMRY